MCNFFFLFSLYDTAIVVLSVMVCNCKCYCVCMCDNLLYFRFLGCLFKIWQGATDEN